MLEAINEIEAFLADVPDFESFQDDHKTFSAVVMQLVIIGEATRALSSNLIAHTKDVEFQKIIGMRNILTHQYFGIDKNLVWKICQDDLPKLKLQIENLVRQGGWC